MTLRTDQLASDLGGAVERDEIVAYYQSQVAVDTGEIVAAEALSRWLHPELGVIPPGTFIPLAEELGLICEIGDHMVTLGCQSAAGWQSRAMPIQVAVNVSGTQLRDPAFAEHIIGSVRSAELDPRLLTIEVTESTEIVDVSRVAERLDRLRNVGVSISVDDFGAGLSSVEEIFDLRATELKIDQSLIQDESVSSRTRLAAVVTFAHDRGLRIVAEGVETEAQLSLVRDLCCDRAQGYLFGRAVPKVDFDRVLDAEGR